MQVQVLNKRKDILGEEHPDTVTAMANLAGTLNALNKFIEAEKLQIQAVDLSIRISGAKHPDTLINMGNLAATYNILGKYEEAEKLEIQVLDITTRTLGAEHPSIVQSMANLADSFRDLKKYSEAERLQIQVLDLKKGIFGEEHPDTKSAMARLAMTQRIMGNNIGAEDSDKLTSQSSSDIPSAQKTMTIQQETEKDYDKLVEKDEGLLQGKVALYYWEILWKTQSFFISN